MVENPRTDNTRNADRVGRLNVQFPIQFSIVVVVLVLLLTALYAYVSFPSKDNNQSLRDILVFFSALSVAGGTIAGSFYTARALGATIHAEQESAILRRKLYAFEFGKRWNDPQMHYARDTLREIVSHDAGEDDLIKYVEERCTNVIHILNFLDEIACVVRIELADHDCVKDQFLYVVTSTWRKLHPWINRHRTKRGSTAIWSDLENLFDDWKRSIK